jgi:hypothetical protein
MRATIPVYGILLCGALAANAPSQPPSPRQQVEDRLARAGLKVGDPLPDARAFDAAGAEFRLRSLRGHYSVLVFGCLT